jgi:hypothetical protein
MDEEEVRHEQRRKLSERRDARHMPNVSRQEADDWHTFLLPVKVTNSVKKVKAAGYVIPTKGKRIMAIYQFAAVQLNEKGQCPLCKRKPLVYKRPQHFKWCCHCDRTFDIETGEQVANRVYRRIGPDQFERDCRHEEDLLEAQGQYREARESRRAQIRTLARVIKEVGSDNIAIVEDAGAWFVTRDGKRIAGPFSTNSAAWRWLDRYQGEPVSRTEQTAEWSFDSNT